MKINAIASVIKGGGCIKLYRNFDEQYISNSYVCYAVSNLPHIETADQLCAVLGIPSEKQGKYNIDIEAGVLPPVLCRNEVDRSLFDDTPIERDETFSISYLGGEYIIFKNDYKIFFVQKAYLKPLSGYDELYYYDRLDRKDNNHSIVIKAGMLLVGVVVPSNIVDQHFAKRLMNIFRLVQKDIDNEKYKERLKYTDERQSFDFPEAIEEE